MSALGPGLVRSQLLGSKPALKSYGRMVVVHLDYSISSLALVCQKSNVNPKRALKSYRWVGGGWWCTWIIASALGPGLVRSQLLGMLRFG